MLRVLFAFAFALSSGLFGASAATLDSDAECRSIAPADVSGCSCQGRYFESKFGPDDGAAALNLVGRGYASQPQITAVSVYDRFGAGKLEEVAQRVLETRGEVALYCPFSTFVAE